MNVWESAIRKSGPVALCEGTDGPGSSVVYRVLYDYGRNEWGLLQFEVCCCAECMDTPGEAAFLGVVHGYKRQYETKLVTGTMIDLLRQTASFRERALAILEGQK